MTDRKLETLRTCSALAPVPARSLTVLGRLLELVDVVPGEVLLPADLPPQWGFCCVSGRLHVLDGGLVRAPAAAPVLFLPDDLGGVALVAAEPSRVLVLPARSVAAVLALAPALGRAPRYRRAAGAMTG